MDLAKSLLDRVERSVLVGMGFVAILIAATSLIL